MAKAFTASNRAIYGWGLGQLGISFISSSFGLLSVIYITGFKMNPILVSWAVTLPRFVDSVIDPLLAHWSDNLHSRWGRRKPFLLGSGLTGAFSTMAVWWTGHDWSQTVQFTYLFAMTTILYCSLGTFWMSHLALGSELSDDYHERTRVMAVRGLFGTIAGLAVGWIYWVAQRPMFGGEINGIRVVSACLALLALVCVAVMLTNTEERFQKVNREHIKILPAIRATLTNRPFLIVTLMGFMANLGLTLYNALYAYVNIYYVCQGDKNLATYIAGIMGTINTVMAFLLFPLATPISRFFGKRKGVMVGAALTALGACLAPLFLTPAHPYWQVLIGSCLIAPVAALKQTLISAINPDIYDMDELETGRRREGLFGAVSGFIGKTEFSLCQLLGGYLVVWAGFNQKVVVQTPETLLRFRWFAFGPYIVFSLLALYFAWRFPITEAMMAETRRKLDARHAALAGGPGAGTGAGSMAAQTAEPLQVPTQTRSGAVESPPKAPTAS